MKTLSSEFYARVVYVKRANLSVAFEWFHGNMCSSMIAESFHMVFVMWRIPCDCNRQFHRNAIPCDWIDGRLWSDKAIWVLRRSQSIAKWATTIQSKLFHLRIKALLCSSHCRSNRSPSIEHTSKPLREPPTNQHRLWVTIGWFIYGIFNEMMKRSGECHYWWLREWVV